jgi:hypothetical protein
MSRLVIAPSRLVIGVLRTVVPAFRLDTNEPKVLSGALRYSQTYHNHPHGSAEPAIRDPCYSESRLECPPRVRYSSEIAASKFTLYILSDTLGGFQ